MDMIRDKLVVKKVYRYARVYVYMNACKYICVCECVALM